MRALRNMSLFLFGILLAFLMMAPYAYAETIPATPTEQVANDTQFYYTTSSAGFTAATQFPSLSAIGSAVGTVINSNRTDGHTFTFNAGATTDPANGGQVYLWYDRDDHQGSIGIYGTKIAGCATGTTPSNGKCVTTIYSCPANQGWTLSGQSCSRVDCPYARNPDGTCAGQCDGKTASGAPDAIPTALYKSAPSLACVGGCVAKRYTDISDYDYVVKIQNGVKVNYYNFVYDYVENSTEPDNGIPCSEISSSLANSTPPAGISNPDNIQQSCGSGQTGGTLNGQYTCVDNTTSDQVSQEATVKPQTTTTQTSNNPDGSSTTTKTTTYTDGSKTIETTTTPSGGGSPTTTTTQHLDSQGNPVNTATAGGGGSGTGSGMDAAKVGEGVQDGLESYCTAHPNSPICKEGGERTASGGANCTEPPACSGDAINCAILNQQWRNRCEVEKQNKNVDDAKTWADDILAEEVFNPLDNPTSIGIGSFDISSLFASSGCPAAKSFSFLGRSYDVSFAEFCNIAEIVGHIIMIAAAMFSLRNVIGAL